MAVKAGDIKCRCGVRGAKVQMSEKPSDTREASRFHSVPLGEGGRGGSGIYSEGSRC